MKTITTLSFPLLSLFPAWAEDATPTPVPVDFGRYVAVIRWEWPLWACMWPLKLLKNENFLRVS